MTRSTRRYVLGIGIASLVGAGLGACGGSSTTTVTHTASSSSQPAVSAATSSTATSAAAGSTKAKAIPDYQPSTVVSKSTYSTVLRSPDAVSKVGAFYKAELATGGWEVRSESSSAYHASFTAHRDHEGVSISVYPSGSGSGISISTHPE